MLVGLLTIKIHQLILEIIKPGGENTKTFLGFDGKENAAADQVGLKEYAV